VSFGLAALPCRGGWHDFFNTITGPRLSWALLDYKIASTDAARNIKRIRDKKTIRCELSKKLLAGLFWVCRGHFCLGRLQHHRDVALPRWLSGVQGLVRRHHDKLIMASSSAIKQSLCPSSAVHGIVNFGLQRCIESLDFFMAHYIYSTKVRSR